MTDNLDEESVFTTSNRDMSAKLRKVRKGTRSCWECKRRKTRCIFPSSGDVTCTGCQRRRLPCVSQDMPESLSPTRKSNRYLSERIARVEDAIKGLTASRDVDTLSQTEREPRPDERCLNFDSLRAREHGSVQTIRAPPTPAESYGVFTPHSSLLTPDAPAVSGHGGTERTALHPLWTAVPSRNDIEIILKESSRSSRYMNMINTQPHSKLTFETLNAPYPTAKLPPPNAHPVILAKCMLMFAITLQIPCEKDFVGLSEPPRVLSRKLVTAATTWLSNKEDTYSSLDCLVCIMLEAMFEIYCGNLRRAWIVYRRAMTMAQMMGLHRCPVPPLKRIDPMLDADPEFMWFRIVYMDRYLSLLLGLPQGTLDKSMGATSVLQREPPLGQFERQLTLIASSILERNESAFATNDMTTTQSIDSELLRISKNMPTSFWRPANFQNLVLGSPENLMETVRVSAQVYYYGLLIQLHLPYMMRRAGKSIEHEYSKITCVNASREIISRFGAHRSFNPKSLCSRPVDFFTLLAAMTLLLAHLDAHHHREATNLLAHRRLSDRAVLEQALERMDAISDVGKDIIIEKSAVLIRRLLDIEADAAEGGDYTATSVEREEQDAQGLMETRSGELRLHIPYLGIIKIARQGPISREQPTSQVGYLQGAATLAGPNAHHISSPYEQQTLSDRPDASQDSTIPMDLPASQPPNMDVDIPGLDEQWSVDDWTFQGVDTAFFDSLMRGTFQGLDVPEGD